MSRRIAALAVLALMASLSACRCPSWYSGDSSKEGKMSRMSACARGVDTTASYRDESDRDMGRTKDSYYNTGYWFWVFAPNR